MGQQNEPRVELELRRAESRAGWEHLWRWLLAGVIDAAAAAIDQQVPAASGESVLANDDSEDGAD